MKNVPESVLAVDKPDATAMFSDPGLCSPVIPVLASDVRGLTDYLIKRGYAATPILYPVVKSSRIRVNIHAGNTEEEIDSFANELLAWAEQERLHLPTGSVDDDVRAKEWCARARARL